MSQEDPSIPQAAFSIPTDARTQPGMVVGDFITQVANCTPPVIEPCALVHSVAASQDTLPLRHIQPSIDAIAAAHGAKQFKAKFADTDVLNALDRSAASGRWLVSVHIVEPTGAGANLTHFFAWSDRFDMLQPFTSKGDGISRPAMVACAHEFALQAEGRLRAIKEQIDSGLTGLAAPRTMDDEQD